MFAFDQHATAGFSGGKAIESVLSQKTGPRVKRLMPVHRADRIRPREKGRPGLISPRKRSLRGLAGRQKAILTVPPF
jgi:hypothetical protein